MTTYSITFSANPVADITGTRDQVLEAESISSDKDENIHIYSIIAANPQGRVVGFVSLGNEPIKGLGPSVGSRFYGFANLIQDPEVDELLIRELASIDGLLDQTPLVWGMVPENLISKFIGHLFTVVSTPVFNPVTGENRKQVFKNFFFKSRLV